MAGTTTKLALYLPGGGLSGLITPDEQVDIDKINDNMRKIDTAIGFIVCTSGTRPSTPFTGQTIIETDTRNTMYWTGSRWAPMDTMPNAASSSIRDVLYPAPISGNQVFRTDIGVGGMPQVYNGTAWRVTAGGMVPIVPSAVVNGTLVGGTVNFTAANPLTLSNVFSADFEFYKLVMRYTKSAVSNLTLMLANGGTPNATGYNWQSNIDIGTNATVPVAGASTASAQIDQGAVTTPQYLTMEIADPFAAIVTQATMQSTGINSNPFTARGSWNHNVASSFTDLVIAPVAGFLAGSLHLYGYNLS